MFHKIISATAITAVTLIVGSAFIAAAPSSAQPEYHIGHKVGYAKAAMSYCGYLPETYGEPMADSDFVLNIPASEVEDGFEWFMSEHFSPNGLTPSCARARLFADKILDEMNWGV